MLIRKGIRTIRVRVRFWVRQGTGTVRVRVSVSVRMGFLVQGARAVEVDHGE